jgi:hypothetical protein
MMSAPTRFERLPASRPLAARKEFYCGSNVEIGFPVNQCYFLVDQGDGHQEWTIAETLVRLAEFSATAQGRILADCAAQVKYGRAWEQT